MESFLGAWCVALSVAFIWPQVWRTMRHDTSHGISPFALMHGLVGSSMWLSYGLVQHDVAVWSSNCSFMVAQSLIISVTYRHGKVPGHILLRVAIAIVAVIVGFTQMPSWLIGYIAIAISGSSVVPQLLHVIRTENLHGISISSYGLTIISSSSWLIYGFVVSDPMLSIQNFFVIPIFVYIIMKAWRWRVANGEPLFA